MKKQKGITLVALIITIIIMLILVAVSVNVIIKSNLIGTAEKTANGYKTAQDRESNGTITINGKKLEEYLKELVTDGSWDGKVNTPKLAEGMTAVAWDENGEEFTPTTNEEWYNYKSQAAEEEGASRWANAKTEDGSYWVWIPRFEYKITAPAEGAVAGTIDVRFIGTDKKEGSTGYTTTKKTVKTVGGTTVEEAGTTNTIVEYNKTATEAKTTSVTNGTATYNSIRAVSKPNVSSWRFINISNIYENSYNYDRSKESHLIKNSEWGAVAYLTHSQYGRNGKEIAVNESDEYITGTGGVGASTTKNVTGVYDLSGGALENVAIFNDQYSSTGNRYSTIDTSYASCIGTNMGAKGKANGGSTKYLTAYSNDSTINGNDFTVGKVSITGDGGLCQVKCVIFFEN